MWGKSVIFGFGRPPALKLIMSYSNKTYVVLVKGEVRTIGVSLVEEGISRFKEEEVRFVRDKGLTY